MRNLLRIILLTAILPIAACNAQNDESATEFSYREGVDFQVLARPVATQDPAKIELAEVFWYGCIHCYRLEPTLNEFAAALPDDVDFVKVPAIWHDTMELHARIYFAAKAVGILDDIHWEVFKAMNEQRNTLANERAILDLLTRLGHDVGPFQRAFSSFGVTSQVTQAKSKAAAYGIRGTPELVVDGKYRVSTSMTGTQERMLEVAAALIERERAQRQAGN
jgi:protein dithiol oxidoreductase (disulfide-forming)